MNVEAFRFSVTFTRTKNEEMGQHQSPRSQRSKRFTDLKTSRMKRSAIAALDLFMDHKSQLLPRVLELLIWG